MADPTPEPSKENGALAEFRPALFMAIAVLTVLAVIKWVPQRGPSSGSGGAGVVVSAGSPQSGSASRLSVVTEPAGASVLINGRLAGATPLSLEGLSSGSYSIRLEKVGCTPVSRHVDLHNEVAINEKLATLPVGALAVTIKPLGAEVLLDGELMGNTPLSLDKIPAGVYELLIRKTNFDPYSARIEISPGDPLVFAEFELKDKVLAMMEGLTKSEPQRLAHYIDLGHYLFLNDKMDESVDVFTQGMEVSQTPLDFNGPGYSGKENVSPEEQALEQRLRKEDESRFLKEIEKHRNWPQKKDTRTFRQKLDQAQEMVSRKRADSWTWAESAGRMNLRNRNFDKAAQIYTDHIAAVPNGPDVHQAHIALIEVYLMQRDAARARDALNVFYKQFSENDAALRVCGAMIYPYHERMFTSAKPKVLEMAEQVLRRGLDLTKEPVPKAQCLFDLAVVLSYQGKAKEAVPLLEKSIAATVDPAVREERSLRLAEALRKAERLEEARELYYKLTASERASIRESAKTGLIFVAADRARGKK